MEEEKGLCRETFVREAIRAMEEAMKTTTRTTTKGGFTKEEEEEEGSTFIKTVFFGGEDDDECAERCVEKMRFDYPDATRKELETLGRSVEERTRGATTTTTTTKAATKNKNFSSRRPTTFSFKQKRTSSRSFSLTTRAMGAKVGDKISGVLQIGPWIDGMPTPVDMAERCKGKKVFLIGLPGECISSRDR